MTLPDPFYTIDTEFEIDSISAGDTGAIPFLMPDEFDLSVYTYARFQLVNKAKELVVDKTTEGGGIVYDNKTVYVIFVEGDLDGFSGTYTGELHFRTTDMTQKKTMARGKIIFDQEKAPDTV